MKLLTDDHGHRTLYLHQSDIGTLRMCPEQARLKLTGEYFDPDSDVAAIGTRTHSFIEWCLHHRQDHGEWPSGQPLLDQLAQEVTLLEEAWPSMWLHPHMVEDLYTAVRELEDCCQRWYNEMIPSLDQTNVAGWEIEKRFDIPVSSIDGDQIRLRGSIDFYDGNGTIWDWKTGRFDSRDGWKKSRYDIQAPIYTYAKHLEENLAGLSFNFGYVPRGKAGVNTWGMTLGQQKWAMMLAEVQSWGNTVLKLGTASTWPLGPDDWHCSPRWCSEFALGKCRGSHEDSFWPDEPSVLVELKRKVDAGLVAAPTEHHPDE